MTERVGDVWNGAILTAIIAGAGVASSAAIAYSLSRRDEDVIIRLRRELQDAREQGESIMTQANKSIEAVRSDVRKSAEAHGRYEKSFESSLRQVRDEAYQAMKSADRALSLASAGTSHREKIASDMANYSSSIRADLDRLAQEVRLTNIASVPVINGNTARAMQAMSAMNAPQYPGGAADSSTPPPDPIQYVTEPMGWQDYINKAPVGGTKYDEKCTSSTDKHPIAITKCKEWCQSRPECKAISVEHKKCSKGRHRCNLYLDHPQAGGTDMSRSVAVWFDGSAKPVATAVSMPSSTPGSMPVSRPTSTPMTTSAPVVASKPPARLQWVDHINKSPVGGTKYDNKCTSSTDNHAKAISKCKEWCQSRPECKAITVEHKDCSKGRHRCNLYLDHPAAGGRDMKRSLALWT